MKRDLAETTTSLSPHVLAHARKTIRTTTSTALIKQRESILHIPTLLADRIQTSANIGGDKQRMRLASFVAVPHDVQGRQAIPQGASQASSLVPMAERPSPRGVVGRVHTIIRKYAPKHQSPQELAHAIVTESRNQGYDPLFVAAVIKAESTFNAAARSNKGAQGLMQIMPATGAWLAKRNDLPRGKLTDPGHNLRLGISYLKHLESEYSGDKVFTLVAYNWGPGHVQSATGGKRRIPKECMTYARKILQDYQRWQSGLI
jgi:hypothetical protein